MADSETDAGTVAPGDLAISDGLQELLLWLIAGRVTHEVLEEVVEKPWHWVELAEAHRANPQRDAAEVLDDLDSSG